MRAMLSNVYSLFVVRIHDNPSILSCFVFFPSLSLFQCPKSTAIEDSHRRQMERLGPAHPWDPSETVGEIARRKYFPSASKSGGLERSAVASRWPPVLRACVEGKAELALGALGAGLFYLQVSGGDI